jgi:hypothetical protein
MRLVTARVTKADQMRCGVQRLVVEQEESSSLRKESLPPHFEALCYEALVLPCRIGDRVLINTTAVDLRLGTGGVCFVVANLTAIEQSDQVVFDDAPSAFTASPASDFTGHTPASAPAASAPAGHIMKLRYTPFQHEVLSVEEPASPYHAVMEQACSLEGVPVVCCELHSQVPLVAAAVRYIRAEARVVYCMTDEAALFASFSTILAQMRESGLLDMCVTCGQALGGDLEAVNLYSGLLAAVTVCKADVIICAQGPGIVGTATRFGHGGLAQAQALNAVAALDGVPIAPLRLSFADARERHQGVSHHTLTALGQACLVEAIIPLPDDLSPEQVATVDCQLEAAGILERHGLITVSVTCDVIDLRGLKVMTMGRTRVDDPAFFSASFAAGILAARFSDEKAQR